MATLLQPEEYDASYFDGAKQAMQHNAGYSVYERWYRNGGEFWKDYASRLMGNFALGGKKVLELGCAKGFVVEDLREMGVDAYGLDVSVYAVREAADSVKPYLTTADARTGLSGYKDEEFDVLFSLRFLECIPETDLPNLIMEMNRISKQQVHIVEQFTGNKKGAGQFYLQKTLDEWLSLDFVKGTKIIAQENLDNIRTK